MSVPELQQNPIVQRVIAIFDADGNGEIDFKGKYLINFQLEFFNNNSWVFFFFYRIY
jgi:hypothetical protein